VRDTGRMPSRHERLTYRANLPLASAPNIAVEVDGAEPAWLRRGRTTEGRTVWRWTGGDVEPFAIEDEGDLQSFLVTRSDGAPFGRIRVRGWVRVRLEATDASAVRFVAQADGRLCAPDGEELGRLELRSPTEVAVDLATVSDPTQRTLARAMPVCHAANAPLLLF
jgi:hypothetical protein